jgi:hypothetical protein
MNRNLLNLISVAASAVILTKAFYEARIYELHTIHTGEMEDQFRSSYDAGWEDSRSHHARHLRNQAFKDNSEN